MLGQKYTPKELRARKNWTQREVANRLGVSVQTYCCWEKDLSKVPVSKVVALAELYGITINQFFL